jgi:tripartite-type tricarboxylate transporter receptor subunit TctC
MHRRTCLATLAFAAAAICPAAWAQVNYPSRPLKLVVGFPPGTATDVATRAVAEGLSRRLGQPVIVDNRPGAASNIAAKAVATSPADGYTIFVGTIANTINAAFPNSASSDLAKEFAPVTMVGSVPNVLVTHPSLGVKSVNELIQVAKAKPGQIAFASSGNGTSPHLSGELFSSMAGIKMLHVPYKGSAPAVNDLLGGQVQLMFSPASSVMQHIRAGKLTALASTGSKRAAIAPDLPTIDELGLKGFETAVWFAFLAPAGTPPDVVAKLNSATHAVLDSPELQEQFRVQGIEVIKSSPDQLAGYIRGETGKWAKVIQSAGIKPE